MLVLSAPILVELQRVPTYPRVQARWPLTPEAIDRYLAYLSALGDVVPAVPTSSPVVIGDPDDDPILQTAITGRAAVLCTRDEAFRHEVVEQGLLRPQYPDRERCRTYTRAAARGNISLLSFW
jgi:predicted nucleic acid-binding protein